MAKTVTYTVKELRTKRAVTKARIKGLDLHMLDASAARAELRRIEHLLAGDDDE